MLRPQDTATRERRRSTACGGSRSTPTAPGGARRWWSGPLAGAREMPVPASYNDIPADAAVRDHVGDVWYQTRGPGPARLGR